MRSLYYFALLALPSQVLAEAAMNVLAFSDQSYTDDLPIVLSATRLEQPISEAPVAMTVIDRDMIEASGARNIPDILRLVPGFQVGYFDGNSPVVAYHGHSGEHNTRLQVLIDGRSVYDPARYAVPWSDLIIDLNDIERIEVIRGPNASTFGNNSFFAVISIITRHALEAQGHSLSFKGGSHATTDASYTFGDQVGAVDYRMTVSTQNDNGTDLLRDETRGESVSYRLDWQADNNNRFMYQGGYKNALFGDHEAVDNENRATGHTIKNNSLFQLIKWEHLPQTDNSFSLQYYYNQHDSTETAPAIVYPAINAMITIFGYDPYVYINELDIAADRHDIEFNHFLRPLDDLRLVWGSSARLDTVSGSLDGGDLFQTSSSQRLELYRGFTHGEWEFAPEWLLNAGYMVEYNEISGNDHSPRVALIHHLNNQHTLRIGKSKATRTPTLWEEDGELIYRHALTSNGGGAPVPPYNELISTGFKMYGNLQSEKITSTELGYIGKFLHNQLVLDITVFQDKTRNVIATNLAPTPAPLATQYDLNYPGYIGTFENALASKIRGLELSMDYKLDKNFRAYIFYSHLRIESSGKQTIYDAESQIQNIKISAPEDSGGMMLTLSLDHNIDTSLMVFRSEDFNWLDRNTTQSAEAYTKVDMRIAKNWRTLREKLTLALIGQNLLGTHYDYNKTTYRPNGQIDHPGSPQDQRVYIELSLKFN